MALTVVLNRHFGHSTSGSTVYDVADQEFGGERGNLGWHVEKSGALIILGHNPYYENSEKDNFVGEPLAEFAPGTWLFVREQE